jgi:hypothetical protein
MSQPGNRVSPSRSLTLCEPTLLRQAGLSFQDHRLSFPDPDIFRQLRTELERVFSDERDLFLLRNHRVELLAVV